jgi:hypothetical protein
LVIASCILLRQTKVPEIFPQLFLPVVKWFAREIVRRSRCLFLEHPLSKNRRHTTCFSLVVRFRVQIDNEYHVE